MKHLLLGLFAGFSLLLLASFSSATGGTTSRGSGGENVGGHQGWNGDLEQLEGGGPGSTKKKVKPGQEFTNGDGVHVVNDEDSSGNITVDPKAGSGASETTVVTQSGAEGLIEGLDQNDTVNLGSNNVIAVSGTSGVTINAGGGSTITVTNTTVAGMGGDIRVNLPSGGYVTVPSGANGVVIGT